MASKRGVAAAVVTASLIGGGIVSGIVREPHPCNIGGENAVAACVTPTYGDVTNPTASLTAPANGATVSGASVSLTATATDNVGVVSVTFKVGVTTISTDSSFPYAATWDSTSVGDGTYTLSAQSVDAAGNLSTVSSISVTVSNSAGAATANLWVDSSGNSSCTRSATAVDFAHAAGHICWNTTATSRLQTAMAASASGGGDTVRVTCATATMGQQTLTTSTHTGVTTFRPETDYCVTIEPTSSPAAGQSTIFINHASELTFSYFNLNGYQTSCGSLGCGGNYAVVVDASSTPVSNDITLDHIQFDVGKLNGGSPIISDHLIQGLTVSNSTFGPTCCGLDVPNSPTPINIGKPGSGAGVCGASATESCTIDITDNTFQFTHINASLWPSSGYGSSPEVTCTDATHCHLDSIHDFGSGGTINILRNKMFGQSCQGIFFEVQTNAAYGPINIIGNTGSSFANGCNGMISLNMTKNTVSGTAFTGDINIGFNEGVNNLNLLAQDGAYASGVHLNIYGNYMPKNSVITYRSSGGTNTAEQCLTGLVPTNLTVTWKYNDWRSGTTCDATDTTGSTTAWVDSSAPPAVTQNMHKTGSTGSADNFVVCSGLIGGGCPSVDYDGDSFAATADAGADQR